MGGLMEESVDKQRLVMRLPISLCKQVVNKYGRPEDNGDEAPAYVRAALDAVAGMELTDEERATVERLRQANVELRMARRQASKLRTAASRATKKNGRAS